MADNELGRLAEDLRGAAKGIRPYVRKAVEVTSLKIKEDWADGANRTGLAGYSRSISFDVTEGPFRIESEIGPDRGRRQGMLGAVEDSGGGWKSSPQHAGRDALETNEDDFYEGLADAAVDALLDGLT